MQAQQPQGMSISDILQIAQMARANNQPEQPQPTGDIPSQTEYTYTRASGAPAVNGSVPPVPTSKPVSVQTPEETGTLSSILNGIKGYFGG